MCKELFDSSIFVLKAIQLRAHLPKRNPHLVMVTKFSSPTVVQLVIPCKLSCTGNGFKKFSYSWWASICMAMSKAISIMRPNTGLGQLFYHTYNMIQRTMKYEHCLGPIRLCEFSSLKWRRPCLVENLKKEKRRIIWSNP